MIDLSPLEKLDLILKEVADNSNPDITLHQIFSKLTDNGQNSAYLGGWSKVELIVIKLVDDKLIERLTISGSHIYQDGNSHSHIYNSYCITFDGEVFHQEGGYMGRFNRENADKFKNEATKSFQLEQTLILNKWTKWIFRATLVAAIYYLLEISKFLYSLIYSITH